MPVAKEGKGGMPMRIATATTFLLAAMCPMGALAQDARERSDVKTVAITFDDLPFANAAPGMRSAARRANMSIRRTLAHRHVPATGFVTEANVRALERDGGSLLRAWIGAGLEFGNHGATHADSNDLDLDGIRREVVAGEVSIVPLAASFARPVKFYRFAYNHVGNTDAKRGGIEQLLAGRGYRIAASTIDTSDYLFDQAYGKAVGNAPVRRRIEEAYLDYSRTQIRYYGALDRRVLGREPPAVMLLHLNRLNAVTLDRLIAIFRSEGFRFASLADVQADDAYRTPPRYTTPYGPMWGYRWAKERGVPLEGSSEQDPPAWIQALAAASP